MGKKRELGFLNKVFSQYKGQYDGWWKDLNENQKCDTSSGKPKGKDEKPIEGKWVCLDKLGILKGEEKKNSKTKEMVMFEMDLWLEALCWEMGILKTKPKLVKCMDCQEKTPRASKN